jgi:hypothetical protein
MRNENAEAAWGSGCPLWFTNYTHLPDGIKPTINDPKLRTYTDEIPGGGAYDWSARSPWRAPGTAKVCSPCGSEGGNPDGCIQEDGNTLGPCVTDGAGFAYGIGGLSLAGNGITTFWQTGSTVEVGWTHEDGRIPQIMVVGIRTGSPAGSLLAVTTASLPRSRSRRWTLGDTSFVQYTNGSGRFEIGAARTSNGAHPPGIMWTRNPIPNMGHGAGPYPKGKHPGIQFPLHTLRGQPPDAPTRLSGYTPLPGAADPCTPSFNPSFGDWILVDKMQVPRLPAGEYVLSSWCSRSAGVSV